MENVENYSFYFCFCNFWNFSSYRIYNGKSQEWCWNHKQYLWADQHWIQIFVRTILFLDPSLVKKFSSSFSRYQLSDGQFKSEEGTFEDRNNEKGELVRILVVRGEYSFIASDGVTYFVRYTADENGYHPIVDRIARKL